MKQLNEIWMIFFTLACLENSIAADQNSSVEASIGRPSQQANVNQASGELQNELDQAPQRTEIYEKQLREREERLKDEEDETDELQNELDQAQQRADSYEDALREVEERLKDEKDETALQDALDQASQRTDTYEGGLRGREERLKDEEDETDGELKEE